MRDLTRRLTLSIAALCALTFALAHAGASRRQEARKKPDDGKLYPVKSVWKNGCVDREGNFVWKLSR